MPFRTREKAEHAKQEQHFKDIERSLKDATELLVTSKREIERSKRIMKDTDQPEAPPQPSQQPTNDADRKISAAARHPRPRPWSRS